MYARSYYSKRNQPAPIKENPTLGPRLEKIKKEEISPGTLDFLDSLLDFFKKRGGLTQNQLNSFEKIESRFSPQEKAKFNLWKEEYRKSHAEDAKVIAKYYSYTGYFTTLSKKILEDESFVPTKKEFNKMVKNNYAEKVLDAYKAEPRFEVNAMVQIRSTVDKTGDCRWLSPMRSRLCFVLANDLPIRTATAGAKRYKVLPMGATDPVEIDEKHLMKPNKKGKYS